MLSGILVPCNSHGWLLQKQSLLHCQDRLFRHRSGIPNLYSPSVPTCPLPNKSPCFSPRSPNLRAAIEGELKKFSGQLLQCRDRLQKAIDDFNVTSFAKMSKASHHFDEWLPPYSQHAPCTCRQRLNYTLCAFQVLAEVTSIKEIMTSSSSLADQYKAFLTRVNLK